MLKKINNMLCFSLFLLLLSSAVAAETRMQEVRKVYLYNVYLYKQYGDGGVMFSVVDEPAEGTPWYTFVFALSSGGGVESLPHAKEFVSILLLAKLNNLPLRIQYETDAPDTAPFRKDRWGSPERQISVVTGIGIDN